MTKTIYAEELIKGDEIVMMATSYSGKKIYQVTDEPKLLSATVTVALKRKHDKNFPEEVREFGRKIELEVVVKDKSQFIGL